MEPPKDADEEGAHGATARSARKWLLARGLPSRWGKNRIKKKSRVSPAAVRGNDGTIFRKCCARLRRVARDGSEVVLVPHKTAPLFPAAVGGQTCTRRYDARRGRDDRA